MPKLTVLVVGHQDIEKSKTLLLGLMGLQASRGLPGGIAMPFSGKYKAAMAESYSAQPHT